MTALTKTQLEQVRDYLQAQCGGRCNAEYNPCEAKELLQSLTPVEPVAWAITYDGDLPYSLWHSGDGPLLDNEVKRLGGTVRKMALYAAPAPLRELSDDEIQEVYLKVHSDGFIGRNLETAFARAVLKAAAALK